MRLAKRTFLATALGSRVGKLQSKAGSTPSRTANQKSAKRAKEPRNPPVGGWADKTLRGISQQRAGKLRRLAVALQLATRGDLEILELRIALYLLAFAKFDEYTPITAATLAQELGAQSNHVAAAAKRLALKKFFVRDRKQKPYSYKLRPYEKF